ncbi:MAG TPA: hypothetical protein VIP57_02180 [Candidatus Dormibacteraeota bacterium]
MKHKMLSGFLVLALAGLSLLWASTTLAASPLWTLSLVEAASTRMTIAPSGAILDEECTDINPDGTELWTLPITLPAYQSCNQAVSDSAGNSYVFRGNTKGEGVVESFDSAGQFRWSTATGTYGPLGGAALGANGDVYFGSFNGLNTKLIGFNEATGAITLEHGFFDAGGVSAYNGGLVVFDEADYTYLGYDGSTQHEYDIPELSGNDAFSSGAGADGDVFSGGYSGTCGTDAHASVEKFTPSGLAWTWTAPDVAAECSQTGVAATPDGGVILGRDEGQSATYTSIGPDGHERWTKELTGATAARLAGYLPIGVDVNGTVGLPAGIDYVCASPSGYCEEAVVKYLSATTGAAVLPEVVLGGLSPEGGFGIYGDAAFTGRTYLTGYFYEVEGFSEGEPVIAAFDKPGLGEPYALFLQQEVTKAGPPAPPPPGQPTLPVTVADGGGGGIAGAPDPGSVNPCAKVIGGFVTRLLAAVKCEWARNKTKAECAYGVSGWLFLPLKVLKGAELANGLLDMNKIAKPLQPLAKVYNDLFLAKFTKHAPPGFKNFKETKDTLGKVRKVSKLIALLPDLRAALSAHDFSEVALDISKIGGFESCVQALSDAMS